MNHLLRRRNWEPVCGTVRSERELYGRPSGRLRVLLRQAQDKLTLRRNVEVRLGPNSLRLLSGTSTFTVSRQQIMK